MDLITILQVASALSPISADLKISLATIEKIAAALTPAEQAQFIACVQKLTASVTQAEIAQVLKTLQEASPILHKLQQGN